MLARGHRRGADPGGESRSVAARPARLEEALRRGLAEKDSSAIFLLQEERAGVQVRDPQVR
jgi:hypothetical protein